MRPGCVTARMVTNDTIDPNNPKNLLSVFEKRFLFKRRLSLEDLKVLPHVEYVNPCAARVRATRFAQGAEVQTMAHWGPFMDWPKGVGPQRSLGCALRMERLGSICLYTMTNCIEFRTVFRLFFALPSVGPAHETWCGTTGGNRPGTPCMRTHKHATHIDASATAANQSVVRSGRRRERKS